MSIFSKIIVTVLVVLSVFYVKDNFFPDFKFDLFDKQKNEEIKVDKTAESQIQEKEDTADEKTVQQFVTVYYIAAAKDGSAVFRKIQREYKSGNKLEIAIRELLEGPSYKEKQLGAYTEIPKGTKLLGVEEQGNNLIINLSSDFQYGGGTDSIYSRMRQLIKTVLANSKNKNIYLYLDGKQVDIIGGEGIMVTQPLSESSLDD